jgi:hypothetical protein
MRSAPVNDDIGPSSLQIRLADVQIAIEIRKAAMQFGREMVRDVPFGLIRLRREREQGRLRFEQRANRYRNLFVNIFDVHDRPSPAR